MFIFNGAAGWSSLVARKAHNLEVPGSNPGPATKPNQSTATSITDHERRYSAAKGLPLDIDLMRV